MESRIMQVFYGNDCLPYKDIDRVVHYPIVGQAFQGASQTTEIRFYIDRISDDVSNVWLAVSKLPNGQVGYNKLEYDTDDNGLFVKLQLTRWHTQYKGDLYINLQCYEGGIDYEEDDDGNLIPVGVPVIQVTGSIKLSVLYATGIIDGGDVDVHTLQELLGYISNKLDKGSPYYIKVVANITSINTVTYKDYVKAGDIVYSKDNRNFYLISGDYPSHTYTPISFMFGSVRIDDLSIVNGIEVVSFADIVNDNDIPLTDYIQNQIETAVNSIFTMTSTPQVLSDEEYALLTSNPNMKIVYNSGAGNEIYIKISTGTSYDTYICPRENYGATSTAVYITGKAISLNHSLKRLDYGSQTKLVVYNKTQMDDLLDLKADKSDTYTKGEIDQKLTSMLVYKGTKTVAELNALSLTTAQTGWFYNVSDSGTLNAGSVEVLAGDNVAWTGSSWDKLTMDLTIYNETFLAAGFLQASDIDSVPEVLTFDANGDITNPNWTGDIDIDYMSPPISDISISEVPTTLIFDLTQNYDNMITNADWTGIMTITY